MEIVLVRHAQPDWEPGGRAVDDPGLTELGRSQAECVTYPLERCAIYDAGSRAFDVPAYLADVRGYWEQVVRLAGEGWTLGAALGERWMIASALSRKPRRISSFCTSSQSMEARQSA